MEVRGVGGVGEERVCSREGGGYGGEGSKRKISTRAPKKFRAGFGSRDCNEEGCGDLSRSFLLSWWVPFHVSGVAFFPAPLRVKLIILIDTHNTLQAALRTSPSITVSPPRLAASHRPQPAFHPRHNVLRRPPRPTPPPSRSATGRRNALRLPARKRLHHLARRRLHDRRANRSHLVSPQLFTSYGLPILDQLVVRGNGCCWDV